MKLELTSEAKEVLQRQYEEGKKLYLYYDADGVCGVNGFPSVRWVDELPDNAITVENSIFPTYINKEQTIFFHEELKLDVRGSLFRLSSKEGMLNPSLTI